MAVGDDAQSIYAFRGANFQNILNFEKKYKDCKKYAITYNYRSVPQILELANNSIEHNENQFKKSMKATRISGVKPFQVNLGDDKDQARFIANQILKLRQDGFNLDEMAILVRASFHTLTIELELKAKNSMREFTELDLKAEEEALILYRQLIEAAKNIGDRETWALFTKIYSDEEAHLLKFQDYIEMEKEPDLGETPASAWSSIFNRLPYFIIFHGKCKWKM